MDMKWNIVENAAYPDMVKCFVAPESTSCVQYASAPCKLTISLYLFARWHLFRHVGYLRHQQQVDL